MREYKILIPICRDSDGRPVDSAVWNWLENRLCEQFGGFTRGPHVDGAWKDANGEIIRDRSRVYYVAGDGPYRRVWRLCEEIAARFDQQCVYVSSGGYARLVYRVGRLDVYDGPERHVRSEDVVGFIREFWRADECCGRQEFDTLAQTYSAPCPAGASGYDSVVRYRKVRDGSFERI